MGSTKPLREATTYDPISEDVLDGRLVVNVYLGRRGSGYPGRPMQPLISIGTLHNEGGSMTLTPLELAALLDGPLQRALAVVNEETD